MGQQQIVDYLKENKKNWFTARQIINRLSLSNGSIMTSLKILRETKQIKHKKIKLDQDTSLNGRRVFTYQY